MSADPARRADKNIGRRKCRRRPRKAENAHLNIGHGVCVHIDLHAESQKADLSEHTGTGRGQQVSALVNDVITYYSQNQADVLPYLFIHLYLLCSIVLFAVFSLLYRRHSVKTTSEGKEKPEAP